MALQSQLFRGDPQLEAAATSDPGHIVPGSRGPHVGKIQSALIQIDGAAIAQDSAYGPATAGAVRAFKQKRQILNTQGRIDDIVGIKTMARLDQEMLAKEKTGPSGGKRLGINGLTGDSQLPPDVIKIINDALGSPFNILATRHILIYFSGVADDFGNGGKLLTGNHGKVVLTQMQNVTPKQDEIKIVVGFGGSLKTNEGVDLAFDIIESIHDPRGKLIIYGFSAGGVNALTLCRNLENKSLLKPKIPLLVTVDVAAGVRTFGLNRTVPPNVPFTRNYFQTAASFGGSFGDRATGSGFIQNIDLDDRMSAILPGARRTQRHGAMEDETTFDAVRDIRSTLRGETILPPTFGKLV